MYICTTLWAWCEFTSKTGVFKVHFAPFILQGQRSVSSQRTYSDPITEETILGWFITFILSRLKKLHSSNLSFGAFYPGKRSDKKNKNKQTAYYFWDKVIKLRLTLIPLGKCSNLTYHDHTGKVKKNTHVEKIATAEPHQSCEGSYIDLTSCWQGSPSAGLTPTLNPGAPSAPFSCTEVKSTPVKGMPESTFFPVVRMLAIACTIANKTITAIKPLKQWFSTCGSPPPQGSYFRYLYYKS